MAFSLSRFIHLSALSASLVLAGSAGTLMAQNGSSSGDCQPNESQQAVLDRVNEARAQSRQCGNESFEAADPVTWSCPLESAARAHAKSMARENYFSHASPDGTQVSDRVSETGYDWSAVGENIAAGQRTADSVVDGWLSSPQHCRNIMKPEYTEMAVAMAESEESRYSPFWVQVFARPR